MATEYPQYSPEPGMRWNPETRQLIQIERRELSPNLENIDIDVAVSHVSIDEEEEGQTPHVIVETVIAAKSERDARRILADQNASLNLSPSEKALRIEDYSGSESGIFGNSIVVGSVISSSVHIGGEVIINGRRIELDGQTHESVAKKIKVVLPKDKEIALNATSQVGNMEIGKIKGQVKLSTQSGRIRVEECGGDLEVNAASGSVSIARFFGELRSRISSGDIKIQHLRGTVNLDMTSGDIKIDDAVLSGRRNRINVTSGNMHIGISNTSLAVLAEATSGDVEIDSEGFTFTRGGGRSSMLSIGGFGRHNSIEGYYGERAQAPELSVEVTSGDLMINHTSKHIDDSTVLPEGSEGFAECSYCGSAYSSKQMKVRDGKIKEIHDAVCAHCSAASPIVHENN